MKSAASAIFQKAANWKTIIESVIYYGDLIRDTCHNQNGRGWGNYKELSWGGEPSHNALKRESWASPSSYIKVSRTTPGVLGQNCKKSNNLSNNNWKIYTSFEWQYFWPDSDKVFGYSSVLPWGILFHF